MFGSSKPSTLLALARLVFAAAVVVVAYGVFAPSGTGPSIMPWDKAEHFTAFYGLTLLGLFAFPKTPPWRMAVLLSLAGALIEIIQALPFVHRDCDVMDWVADSLGVAAALAPVAATRWRQWLEGRSPAQP